MSYGRKAPEGIPQNIWDRAIAEWLDDDSTVDSDRIMRIAKRLMVEMAPKQSDATKAQKFDAWWEHTDKQGEPPGPPSGPIPPRPVG